MHRSSSWMERTLNALTGTTRLSYLWIGTSRNFISFLVFGFYLFFQVAQINMAEGIQAWQNRVLYSLIGSLIRFSVIHGYETISTGSSKG